MYNTIHAEEMNKPAVALCNKDFVIDAKSAASSKGMPGLRVVAETIPCECDVTEKIEAGVNAVVDEIIASLTKPLTAEEKSPKPKEVEKLSRIVFKGNLEEVNQFFYKRGWSDGLPIIPPTEEAVQEMLTGTDLPADHVVDKILPRLGKATMEKIAINAVMAGALPTYMPVLIAGIQALMDPRSLFGVHEVSTGSWAPFWIANGRICNDLNINNGTGALSPGDIANATIGRAMGLIVKNIGGARKGIEDMGTFGNPGKYTMVIAENEDESPWEPLHVEQGLNKEDSAISLFFPNCSSIFWPYGTDDKGILNGVIYNVIPVQKGPLCVILPSCHAKTLADKGWTKREITSFISEYARSPAYRNLEYWGAGPPAKKEKVPMNPLDSMPIFHDPDWIRVIVAGGPGNTIGLFTGLFLGEGQGWVTKKLEIPKNWDKLVKKYKNIAPVYIRY